MNKINGFEKKVLSTIKKHNMINKGDRVLVGFSGGKDSAVLVFVLSKLSRILDFELFALHVNHGIRGEEAARDEAFSKSFCESLAIPFSSEHVDVLKLSQDSSLGLEAVARDARYSAFEKFSKELNCTKIATAHTLTDNSETVLISLFRNGTISPIPPKRDNIIRPLIEQTCDEVVSYAKENGISFVDDSTNFCDDYLRNHIRLNVLPTLREKLNGVDRTLLKAGKIETSFKNLAESEADKYFEKETVPESLLSLASLAKDPSRRTVLFCVLSRIFAKEGMALTFEQFEQISTALLSSKVGTSFSLGEGKNLVFGYDRIYFDKEIEETGEYFIKLSHGENKIPGSPFSVFVETPEEYEKRCRNNFNNKQKINKLTKKISIRCNIIDTAFYARCRRVGDEYVCGGITRNIKKYMINAKIPKALRSSFPIVCDEFGIVFAGGLGIADRLKNSDGQDEVYLSLDFDGELFER